MKRHRVRKNKDRKIFRHTAEKTRKINVLPVVSRGGIRL